jgi:hypothetical protein
MEHSKRRPVYTDKDGVRIGNVPDLLLQLPKNLIAYACIKNDDGTCSTVKAVKFAVFRQPIPSDYICEQDAVIEDILMRLELLESLLKDIETGKQQFTKFTNMIDAAKGAVESGRAGADTVSAEINAAIAALNLADTYAAKTHGHEIADVNGLSDAIAAAKKAGTDATPSLYEAIGLDDSGYPIWSQPTGAHDAYNKGDIVDYNGILYESVIDGNTYSPETYPTGWKQLS